VAAVGHQITLEEMIKECEHEQKINGTSEKDAQE
jgi:hypothetical protein